MNVHTQAVAAAIRTTQVLFGNNANSTAETRVGDVVEFVPYNQTNASVVTLLGEKTVQGFQMLSSVWSTAQRDFLKRLNGAPATSEDEGKEKTDEAPTTSEDDGAANETEPTKGETETEKETDDETAKENTTTDVGDAEQGKTESPEEATETTDTEVREDTETKERTETEKGKEPEGIEDVDTEENATNENMTQGGNQTNELLNPAFEWVLNNSGRGTKTLHGKMTTLFKDEDSAKHAQRILFSLVGVVLCLLIVISTTTMIM